MWFVSLRDVNSIEGMIEILMDVIGPSPLSGKEHSGSLKQLWTYFHHITSTCVLIIDNVDDLLSSKETKSKLLSTLERILLQNGNLRIICTSREAIKFAKHNLKSFDLRIGKLQIDESIDLLQNLVDTQDLVCAERECVRLIHFCDNAPLALKLLAAIMDQDRVTPAEILSELKISNFLKVVDSEDYPDDQRMSKIFEASFLRLPEQYQRMFVCLSIFPSSFDASAAAAVLGIETIVDAKKKLGLLERKAFIEYNKGRYSMHTLLQAFAQLICESNLETCSYVADSQVLCQAYFFQFLKELNNKFLTGQSLHAVQSFCKEKENIIFCLQDLACNERFTNAIEEIADMDIFLDTVFWNDSKLMSNVYDQFLIKCKQNNMPFLYVKVLLSKCFCVLHWEENHADEMLLEAFDVIHELSSVPSGVRGKLLCFAAFRNMILNHVDDAIDLFERGIPLLSSHLTQPVTKVIAMHVLADCYKLKQCVSKASRTMQEAFTLSQKHEGLTAITQKSEYKAHSSNDPFLSAVFYFLSHHLKTTDAKHNIQDLILNSVKAAHQQCQTSGDRLEIATHYDIFASSLEQIGCTEDVAIRRKALDIRLRSVGKGSESTAWSYHSLGLTYCKHGNYGDALFAHRHALDIRIKLLGEENEDTALSLNNIGMMAYRLGDYTTALDAHKRALDIRRKVFGEMNEYTAWSYHNLGMTSYTLGDYNNALSSHRSALDVRLSLLGEVNEDTAWSYHNLGEAHCMLDDYGNALKAERRALDIRLTILGEQNEDTAWSYHNLSEMHYMVGDYSSALEAEQHALDIRLKLIGEFSKDTAWSYYNLGVTHYMLGKYSCSLDAHKQALKIRIRLLGEEDEHTTWSYCNVNKVCRKLNFSENAI